MMNHSSSELVEVRPGRFLFHRAEILGSSMPKLQILFLHGTCASSSQYDRLIQAFVEILKDSAVFHLFDSISCGKSPPVRHWGAYHTDEAVHDLSAILETQMDRNLPTLIVGHSYAPTVIIRCFNRYGIPSHIKGCVFLSSGLDGDVNPIPNGGHPIFLLPVFILQCLQPALTESFLKMAYHPKTDPQVVQDASKLSSGNDMYMAKAFHRHHQWATSEECRALHGLPLLIVHGKDDRILPIQAGAQLADNLNAALFVVIEDASHQIMEEKPLEVAQQIEAFIRKLELI